MTINQRIKYFRKNVLRLNQRQFASALGMAQTGVSTMEQKGATITDRTIKSICLAYNLSEDWLRYGTESMFVQPDTFSLDEFIKEKGGTDLEIDIVKAYFEIDLETRRMLVEHFKNSLAKQAITSNNTLYSDIPDDPEEFERLFPPIEPEEEESNIG